MPKMSAGLLMYRLRNDQIEVLLVHPGGPFFRNKDDGVWSIPKGEIEPDEDHLQAARREFSEELGFAPAGPFTALSPIRQKGGKTVYAWACEGDCDPQTIASNTFTIEWPPRSKKFAEFPEIDRAEFFTLKQAKQKINPAQFPLVEELARRLPNRNPS